MRRAAGPRGGARARGEARRANFAYLREGLSGCEEALTFVEATPQSDPSWFGLLITVREDAPFTRGEVVEYLEPADILTDGMRGRAYVWDRLRVNLIHVPEEKRPPQEPLDPDYNPWEGYEWPDQSGQLDRAPKKKPQA